MSKDQKNTNLPGEIRNSRSRSSTWAIPTGRYSEKTREVIKERCEIQKCTRKDFFFANISYFEKIFLLLFVVESSRSSFERNLLPLYNSKHCIQLVFEVTQLRWWQKWPWANTLRFFVLHSRIWPSAPPLNHWSLLIIWTQSTVFLCAFGYTKWVPVSTWTNQTKKKYFNCQ